MKSAFLFGLITCLASISKASYYFFIYCTVSFHGAFFPERHHLRAYIWMCFAFIYPSTAWFRGKERYRNKTQEAAHGGEDCKGENKETKQCSFCEVGPWSEWGLCNSTCTEAGVKTRRRAFNDACPRKNHGQCNRFAIKENKACDRQSNSTCIVSAVCVVHHEYCDIRLPTLITFAGTPGVQWALLSLEWCFFKNSLL